MGIHGKTSPKKIPRISWIWPNIHESLLKIKAIYGKWGPGLESCFKKKAPEMVLFEGPKKVARAHFWGVILGPFQKSIFSFFWGSQNLDFP